LKTKFNDSVRRATVYAICLPGAATVSLYTNLVDVPENSRGLSQSPCTPQNPHVIGGGLFSAGGDTVQANTAIASTRPGRNLSSWEVRMDNYNLGGITIPIQAQAVCSPPL
jgi:hypothetical protein